MFGFNNYRMRLVLVGIVISGLLSMAAVCSSAEYIWTNKADMPTPRWSHTSAVVNDKIYVIGGGTSEPNDELLSTVEEYDPVTDTWTRKADMPTARGWMSPSSAVVNGKIYVIGGWGEGDQPLSTVEEYDPVTDTWTRKADMPTRRDSLATVAVKGKIYAIGGYPLAGPWGGGSSTVEVYDPKNNTWTRKADMLVGLGMLNAHLVSGKIYVVGGRPYVQSGVDVLEYDPATDTWTRKANILVGTSQMDSVVLDEKIFVIGGWYWSNNSPYTTIQMYDPKTDIWTREADAPFRRAAFSAEVLRGRIFVIGGTDRPHPCPATSTVYECDTGYIPQLYDFNGDGIVDADDMCIMVDHWGENYPLCDIAPPPFGDGIVDVQDLTFLAEHLFEDVNNDPTLVAHWALDEIEGFTAHDSVNGHDDYVMGGAVWQPAEGVIHGALELDGIDDCLITTFGPDPAAEPFSVVAWIKGGGPGQVIFSQSVSADWLKIDDSTGTLMTELKNSDGLAEHLLSEKVISDGQWHRIGLVWDGLHRMIYVDGVIVAEDTQDGLEASVGGLCVGVGKYYTPGSFFSGLIDDIRIYNRAVSP